MKKILLAATGSPASYGAARVGFEMARSKDAQLIVFHVMGVPTSFSQVISDARTGDEVEVDQDYRDWVEDELRSTYAALLEKGGDVRFLLATGLPHREILRAARDEDVDLIIMGAHSGEPGGGYKGYPGSPLQSVAKAARCPVMSVHRESASYRGGFSHVIFGTDFSKQADSAFKYALSIAREFGGEMTLLHALDISGLDMDQNQIEDRLIEARKKIRDRYVSQMGEFKEYEIEVWEGVPYVEIVKLARERQGDLIVMAHHTRELDPELARIGSTMEQVILRANCPVVSVNKPDKVQETALLD